MNKLNAALMIAALSCAPGAMWAQQENNPDTHQQNTPKTQPSPSQNDGDIPHQGPGTDNPDLAKDHQKSNLPNGQNNSKSTTKRSRQAKQKHTSDTSNPH